MTGHRFHRRRSPGFILLEVLVSLTILSLALSAVMRSITLSLRAASLSRQVSTASILARGLIDGWEIERPEPGQSTGDFGPAYPRYHWTLDYEPTAIDYPDAAIPSDVERPVPLRMLHLTVTYVRPGADRRDPVAVLRVDSALTDSEMFTPQAREANEIWFED